MTSAVARMPVLFSTSDPISKVGLAAALRARPEVVVVEEADAGPETVVITVADRVDDGVSRLLRGRQARGQHRLVLVVTELADGDLLTAVELGVRAVSLRADATPDNLLRLARTAAAGEAALPPEMLGRLLTQVSRLQRQVLAPKGLTMAGLTHREVEVLRLVAQGFSTGEIAERLRYSERTIKTVLHDIVSRFQLRNRTHAVVYAMQQGLI